MASMHVNFRSDFLTRSVYPEVFLPDYNCWNDQKPPYKTLYFLTGYSGGALETTMFTNFAMYSALYGIAIVVVDGENSFYVDDEKRNVLYSRYIGEELVAVTRKALPLSCRREDTYIGGISMGGYGALINGLRYADTFSRIGLLSPALGFYHDDGTTNPDSPITAGELYGLLGDPAHYHHTYKDYAYASRQFADKPQAMPKIFLACGLQDTLVLAGSREYARTMAELGAPLCYYEVDGGHDHVFWKKALTPCCEFLTEKGAK